MTTPKLKNLIKTAAEIINIYFESNFADASSFQLTPFYEQSEKGSEVVTIVFDNLEFDHEFLEPLAKKLSATQICWSISRCDEKFNLNLY